MQSSTVLLGYFWPISSTTVLASAGKYRIVSVGNGTAAEDDKEGSSSNILSQLPDRAYIMISKTDLYIVVLYNVIYHVLLVKLLSKKINGFPRHISHTIL